MAAPRFHELEIAAVRLETPDAVAITFAIPEENRDAFAFLPGQYLTLRADIGGEDMRRSYSICSPLGETDRRTVGVKHIENGRFSGFAQTLKKGDRIQVMPPQGRFTVEVSGDDHEYLLLAAGSGITPCLSIAKSVLAGEPNSSVTLLYANRNSSSVMFLDDLNDLKDRYTTRFTLLHVMDEEVQDVEIMNGRLDAAKLETLASHGLIDPARADAIYICGPEPMIRSASTAMAAMGVNEDRIRFELFTPAPGSAPAPAPKPKPANGKGPNGAKHGASVDIILDGARRTIEVDAATDTVLTAAMKAGMDLPFSCAGGMCCTCRCKIVEGTATMDENFSLEPWEIEAGFTLSCQARPDTDRLVLDFDAQ